MFGLLASAAVAAPARAEGCSGPFDTGRCGSALCSGSNCRNSLPYKCYKISGYCHSPGVACWTSGTKTCCKCKCYEASYVWYCYCLG
jgi:hypothetical protein